MVEKLIPYIKKSLWLLLTAALIALGSYLLFKGILYLLPILIGLVIALTLDPLIRIMVEKAHFRRNLASALVILVLFLIIGGLLVLIGIGVVTEIKRFSQQLPQIYASVNESLNSFVDWVKQSYSWLPPEITANINNSFSNLSQILINFLKSVISVVLSSAVSIPQALVFITVMLLSTYFFSSDKVRIFGFFKRLLRKDIVDRLSNIKTKLLSTLVGYVKAQLTIMAIIFCEIAIGFTILGIRQPLIFALIIAILDQVPYVGVMTFLVPMSVYYFATGNVRLGISVLIVYAIIWTVRQLTDPKILGHNIGVHPLLTLLGLYVGLQVFGFIGLILGPFIIVVVKTVFIAYNGDRFGDLETPPPKGFPFFRKKKPKEPPEPDEVTPV